MDERTAFDQGNKIASRKEWDLAHACFDQALRVNPERIESLRNRGIASLQMGDFNGALVDLLEASRIDPETCNRWYAEALYWRGISSREIGGFDQALADFGEASRLDPYVPAYYTSLGEEYGRRGDLNRSTDDYTCARECYQSARRLLAEQHLASRHTPVASYEQLAQFEKQHRETEESVMFKENETLLKRAVCYANGKDYYRAFPDLMLLMAFERFVPFESVLSVCHQASIELRRILLACEQDFGIEPYHFDGLINEIGSRHPESWYWKSPGRSAFERLLRLLRSHGLSSRAERYKRYEWEATYEEELVGWTEKYGPPLASALCGRGNAYAGKGDYHRAIANYDEAIRLIPTHANAITNRAVARKKGTFA
jgi:tetratricopeptide (TPR) repeat protein